MPTLRYSTAIIADRLAALNTDIGASAKIQIYTGTIPANVNTAVSTQTLLVTLTGNATAFGAVGSGTLTAGAITSGAAVATGTATWARIFKADGTTPCVDIDVGTSGATLNLSSTSVNSGQNVAISSFVITGQPV